ncbi:protein-export chaperone SecB [Limosilactobacillus sp.]|uniref:protein-export chaperone SecB n=1 Tax=Limosilactobacillus sp. TaxID=2773925 RepID=UPI003EFD4727
MDSKNNKSIIQFTNPELVESIFMENPNYQGDLNISQNMKISTSHGKIVEEDKFNKSSIVSLTVSNFDQIDMDSNKPFFIRQTMRAKFVWKKGLSSEKEENFLKINAAALLLSYIRPQVRSITSLSKFSEQNIPFIDFASQL